MVCKGICIRHKVLLRTGELRYDSGLKHCQACSIFMIWATNTCPCYGIKLKSKPRTSRSEFHLTRIQLALDSIRE